MWSTVLKKIGGWIVRYGPGLVAAILEARAKQAPPPPEPPAPAGGPTAG